MEPESSSPYPQVPATRPYPEPTPSSPHDPLQLPEGPTTVTKSKRNNTELFQIVTLMQLVCYTRFRASCLFRIGQPYRIRPQMSPGPPSMPAVMRDTQSITSGLVTSQQLWSTCVFPITTERPPETEQ